MTRVTKNFDDAGRDTGGERLELEPDLLELDAALAALGAVERAHADDASIVRMSDAGAGVLRGESPVVVTTRGPRRSGSLVSGSGWIAAAAGIALVAAAGLTLVGLRGAGPSRDGIVEAVTVAVGYAEYDLVDEVMSDDSFWSSSFAEDEAAIAAGAAAVEAGLGSPLDDVVEWNGEWNSESVDRLGWFDEEAG